ncbi:helix-turn-helix domain-containing protein [Mucilaginibacter sp. PAMB04168]|uniref:helix-turn-helix domain-containing protein n=1 Tax=Mucilaginibacter sp. PAMB04168 TaxID=3138567 RepID=UPI0031F6C74A
MVAIEIITKEDLMAFKADLLNEIKHLLNNTQLSDKRQWLKSKEVRELLGISASTLQNLRVNGTMSFTRIGGTVFYKSEDIMKLLNGKR